MQDMFIKKVQSIVQIMLEKYGLLTHEWHMGTVDLVNADNTLNVKINGSPDPTPSVHANPNIVFSIGDKVWVHYVNRNPNNLFIPYKR